MKFRAPDIAEYYNTTQAHYERWWNLRRSHSLHYGIWQAHTNSFAEALQETNTVLMNLAEIQPGMTVLDAGCGVGGAALRMALDRQAKVTGISLSDRQVHLARQLAEELGVAQLAAFEVMDYHETAFESASFDVVWACESFMHCDKPERFLQECLRLLKPGGCMVMSDFFLTSEHQSDPDHLIEKWTTTWAVSSLIPVEKFVAFSEDAGFSSIQVHDYTAQIQPSARRMYWAAWLGMIPSALYNLTHPGVSRFARNHYKCGIYQYKALQKNLWRYKVIKAVKG